MSLTVEQKTNYHGFPKPGELIEMTGTHLLEASDRAVLNLVCQNAHDSGRLLDPNAEWEIPLSAIRQSFSKHESSDRLRDSLNRLMSLKVNVAYMAEFGSGQPGSEKRVVITGLFDFFDITLRCHGRGLGCVACWRAIRTAKSVCQAPTLDSLLLPFVASQFP